MMNIGNYGEAIRAVRNARKMSQEEVAKRAGISRSYLATTETGEYNMSLKTLFKVLDAMGVQMRFELKEAWEPDV